ncbi:MAG: hypothetical protein IKW00_09655 [Clostridia bacterium]|nr:hypothetical protein [Clostridia bacterium]
MASFWRFIGIAAAGAVLSMTVRGAHKEMGAVFSLLCGTVLILLLTDRIAETVSAFGEIARLSSMTDGQTALILKVLGVSLLSEFAAQACRDAGEEGIALRVELGGRIMLIVLALPLLKEITQLIAEMTA